MNVWLSPNVHALQICLPIFPENPLRHRYSKSHAIVPVYKSRYPRASRELDFIRFGANPFGYLLWTYRAGKAGANNPFLTVDLLITEAMNAPSRQRVFGAKSVAISQQAINQTVGSAELRHNGGKLVSWSVLSIVFAVTSVWIVAAGGLGADSHSRGSLLVHLMGPRGMTVLSAFCGICCVFLASAYLRLLVSRDRLAARATSEGLAINGVWGRKSYVWRDIVAVRLHVTKPRSREIAFIRIERLDGGSHLVSTNTVEGGRVEVERWIQQVQSYLHR